MNEKTYLAFGELFQTKEAAECGLVVVEEHALR